MKYFKIALLSGIVGAAASVALFWASWLFDYPVRLAVEFIVFAAPMSLYYGVYGIFTGPYEGPVNPSMVVVLLLEWAWFILLGRIPFLMRKSAICYKKLIAWLDRPK